MSVSAIRTALSAGASLDEVLHLVDHELEASTAAGDRQALEELAAVLESTAAERDASWSGLTVAAARAHISARDIAPPPSAPTAAPVTPAPTLAGWWRRVGAFCLDLFLVFTALGILDVMLGSLGDIVLILYPALAIGYFAGFYAFHRGATVGMIVCVIAARRPDGTQIGLGRSIARATLLAALFLTGLIMIDALVAAFDRGRSIHDRLAGTMVVRATI